ncbi:uncharacterized protein LOC144918223 [Branchiostoma floridae x Branchiostoma belcheri]
MTAVDNMSKEELVKDLSSRGVLDVHEARGKPAKELCMILKNELHGIKRPPALLFHCPETSLESLNLEKYEVLPCEPLHDISHHIQHIFEELPFHVSSDVKNDIKQVYNATLGTKELKRGCDYRVALIALANTLEGKATPLVLQLITSLLEIQRLCYLPAEKRCQREILRLHNQSFIHAMCMRQVIPKPKKLTARCLYGIYFHTLTTHAPTVFRIVALSSAHTESEERVFNQLRGIHRTTGCSRRPGQVIGNMLVRTHCENVLRSDKGTTYQPDSIVSNAAKVKQTGVEDTIVPLHIIDKFPKAWQAHCERLADYLQCGKGEWWTVHEEGVIFHDGSTHPDSLPSGPQMLHFRSSSLKTVEQHLCQSWKKCLDENTVIPLRKVYMYETDGERNLTAIKRTNFIPMFEACSKDLDTLTATADSYDNDMMEGEEEEDISELVQQVREVEDVFTVHTSEDDAVHTSEDDAVHTSEDDDVHTSEDDAVHTSEDDAVHTSEDDAVHTSEDDAVHTSEDDAVHTSEDDAVHTSEDDAVHTSEDDAVHTSEDDAVHTSEDDRTVYSGEEQHGPTTSFDKQPPAAFMSPPGPSAVRSRCSEHTPLRRDRRGKTDPVQLFSSAQPSGHTSEKGKEEKQSQSSWTRNLRGLLGDIQEIESFEALRKKLKEGRNRTAIKPVYDKTVAILQTKVSKQYSNLKKDIEAFEREYMFKHNCAIPTLDDIREAPADIKALYNSLKQAKSLMKAFGMI